MPAVEEIFGGSKIPAAGKMTPEQQESYLAKYEDPDEAVDRRELMLADHGLYGPDLTEGPRAGCATGCR